jgi:hypothetical protein
LPIKRKKSRHQKFPVRGLGNGVIEKDFKVVLIVGGVTEVVRAPA